MKTEPPSIEKIAIWILEALEEERQREPDYYKCRLESAVLGALKGKHGLDDDAISRGLQFCIGREYILRRSRTDGIATVITDDGLRMVAQIQQCRLDEEEKKKWSRADKIALASLVLSVVTFFVGVRVGAQSGKNGDNTQTLTQSTNAPTMNLQVPAPFLSNSISSNTPP